MDGEGPESEPHKLWNFALVQLEHLRAHNPHIHGVLARVARDETFRGEVVKIMAPILYALQMIWRADGGHITRVDEETACRALENWQESNKSELSELVEQEFARWMKTHPGAIHLFSLFLDSLADPGTESMVRDKAREAFARVLHMIRLERERKV